MKAHFGRQVKLDPRIKPFVRLSRWRGFVVIIGRNEIGLVWR